MADDDIADRIISVESGGDPNAQNPLSSAGGAGQFIDSTWLSMLKQHRPDLAQGASNADLLALKSDPVLSKQMTAAYAADNAGILQQRGLPVTPGSTYLAHFAGPQGAVGILSADPNASAASVLGQGFARANPSLANYTAGQLASWADRKMGGSAPFSIGGVQAAMPAAPGAPTSLAPNNPTPTSTYSIGGGGGGGSSALAQMVNTPQVPQLRNILPPSPNPFGVQSAPFSLGA